MKKILNSSVCSVNFNFISSDSLLQHCSSTHHFDFSGLRREISPGLWFVYLTFKSFVSDFYSLCKLMIVFFVIRSPEWLRCGGGERK